MSWLLRRFDAVAVARPHAVACRSCKRDMTYGELHEKSRRLASWLEREVANGCPVAIRGQKEPEMLAGFLGAMRARRPYIPIEDGLPQSREQQILALSGAALTLTPADIERICGQEATPRQGIVHETDPGLAAYCMFTSGSTGAPRGVVISHRCLEAFASGMLAVLCGSDPCRNEVVLNQTPFAFDFSVMDIWLALLSGGTLVGLSRPEIEHPSTMHEILRSSGVTTWISTPSFVHMCLAERSFGPQSLKHVRRLILGGEALPPTVARQVMTRFASQELWNAYGPTEATVICAMGRVEPWMIDRLPSIPIGEALPGTWIGVMDETGRVLGDNEPGEIVIAGPNVSPGYLRPSAQGTAQASAQGNASDELGAHGGDRSPMTVDRPSDCFFTFDGQPAYRTGDRGHRHDGQLLYDGRMHGMVKIRGNRIEPGDVEVNLARLPGVSGAVVVVRNGPPAWLLGYVVPDGALPTNDLELSTNLRMQLAEKLPAYMIPRRIVFVSTFPVNANGKIDRTFLASAPL